MESGILANTRDFVNSDIPFCRYTPVLNGCLNSQRLNSQRESLHQKITAAMSLFDSAKQCYADFGIDVEKAFRTLASVPVSLQCWQGDDVGGFENTAGLTGGGILATGHYPGKARTPDELRQDADRAFALIPGKHRFSLHAIYLDNVKNGVNGKKIDRNEITPEHFQRWIDWAKTNGLGLDFNPTYFSHPLAADGFTLAHSDKKIRTFWIQHGIACRKIAAEFGKKLKTPSVVNFWVPDGYKDIPVDRLSPRKRLKDSLDEIFDEEISPKYELDAVESKLFGIGCEAYTVGSHEFYLGYAAAKNKMICFDAGHFHPTEGIADKLSAASLFGKEILLHVSRPVRWDSDHVVIWNDDLRSIAEEIVRCRLLERVHIGLDFFDGTVNRIAAWVIGTRAMLKALLFALLEPIEQLRQYELDGDYTSRLAVLEELKSLPFGPVWDRYCEQNGVPAGVKWLDSVKQYESEVLPQRR